MAAAPSPSLQHRGLTINFEMGDLTQRNDDSVALSCDTGIGLTSPLCAAFVRLAGSELRTSALQQIANHPQFFINPQPIAINVPATGGLRTRNVILLPIDHSFGNLVVDIFREMFQSAIQANSQSLAFPMIGTGGYRLVNHYECAQAIFDALQSIQNFGTLTSITLINTSDFWTRQYYDNLSEIIQNTEQQQPNANNQQNPIVAGNAVAVPNNEPIIPFNASFRTLKLDEIREMREKCLKEREEAEEKASSSTKREGSLEDDRLMVCAVCLNDMLDEVDNYSENSDTTIVQINRCLHTFHRYCLVQWFHSKPICPVCTIPCMEIRGNQPINGVMQWSTFNSALPGYPNDGHIRIDYHIRDGIQTDEHPNPGSAYTGTFRSCYLPNNADGRVIRDLLQIAFNRRLIFTIGQSLTTGRQNTTTWNGIHHKTSRSGGPQRYGYPDPTYLQRVKEELSAFGITEDLLNQEIIIDPNNP